MTIMKRLLLIAALLGWGMRGIAASSDTPVELTAVLAAPADRVAGIFATTTTTSSDRAGEILEKLAAGFRASEGYSVAFEVCTDDTTIAGRYDVKGEGYYMQFGDAEVYCDGKTRYEIDNRRREVTVTDADPASRNIFNNPVHAFDFLGSQYTPALVSEESGMVVILLTPTALNKTSTGAVTVTISTAVMRPRSLVYDYDGMHVAIDVKEISPLKAPLKAFAKGGYADYEFIDFR